MDISSNGQLCYGIAFEDEYHFPWMDDKWRGDEEDWWWKGICGYKPLFEIYDKEGAGYINGERPSEAKITEYYDHYRKFQKKNPLPVEIVRHCSYDYTMYIIAVKDTYTFAYRGYPKKINFSEINTTDEQRVIDFCEKYCKPIDDWHTFPEMKCTWLLSSMYG